MAENMSNGILSKRSNYSVHETLERLKQTLQGKGVTVFAIVDHSGEAEKVGLKKTRRLTQPSLASASSFITTHANTRPASDAIPAWLPTRERPLESK